MHQNTKMSQTDLINLGGEFDLVELVGQLHDGLVLHLDHPLVAPCLLLQPEEQQLERKLLTIERNFQEALLAWCAGQYIKLLIDTPLVTPVIDKLK